MDDAAVGVHFFDSLQEDDLQTFLAEPTDGNDQYYAEELTEDGGFEVLEFWDSPVLHEFMASSKAWFIIQIVLYAIAIVLILVANVMLLATIRGVRYMKTTLNRYVASLAVCDVLMALYAVVRLVGLCISSLYQNPYFCLGHTLGLICISITAQLMMLFIAFDCYFSVWHPMSYARALTPWKASVAIFLAWIYSGAVSLLPLIWFVNWRSLYLISGSQESGTEESIYLCITENLLDSNYVIFLLAHYGIAVIIVVIVYICIYYEIRTKRVIFSVYQQRQRQRQVYEDRRKRDIQNAHCMAIVSLIFVIFLLPHYFLMAVHVFVIRLRVTTLLEAIALFIVVYHSSFKPLIYLCKLDMFQVACYKVLCCCPGQEFPSRPPSDSVHLHSMSFRNHMTGSMMSLHTTLAGKMVRIPRITVTASDDTTNTDGEWGQSSSPSNSLSNDPNFTARPATSVAATSSSGAGYIDSEVIVYQNGDDDEDEVYEEEGGGIYHRNGAQTPHIVGSPVSVSSVERQGDRLRARSNVSPHSIHTQHGPSTSSPVSYTSPGRERNYSHTQRDSSSPSRDNEHSHSQHGSDPTSPERYTSPGRESLYTKPTPHHSRTSPGRGSSNSYSPGSYSNRERQNSEGQQNQAFDSCELPNSPAIRNTSSHFSPERNGSRSQGYDITPYTPYTNSSPGRLNPSYTEDPPYMYTSNIKYSPSRGYGKGANTPGISRAFSKQQYRVNTDSFLERYKNDTQGKQASFTIPSCSDNTTNNYNSHHVGENGGSDSSSNNSLEHVPRNPVPSSSWQYPDEDRDGMTGRTKGPRSKHKGRSTPRTGNTDRYRQH